MGTDSVSVPRWWRLANPDAVRVEVWHLGHDDHELVVRQTIAAPPGVVSGVMDTRQLVADDVGSAVRVEAGGVQWRMVTPPALGVWELAE